MINFKNIVDSYGIEKADSLIMIGEHPVWDYKPGPENTIYLITQDPYTYAGDDFVTLKELQKYIRTLKIPYESVIFATEADNEQLTRCKVGDKVVELKH